MKLPGILSKWLEREPENEGTAELHRKATRLKNSGDWPAAIEVLQEVQSRMRASGASYPIENWTRLPLYLQQAGRFQEAMTEFKVLLEEIDDRRAREFGHHPERFWPGFAHRPRADIYDKMRLACQRQKLPEEAEKYAALRDQAAEKAQVFREKLDVWRKEERAKERAKIQARLEKISRGNLK